MDWKMGKNTAYFGLEKHSEHKKRITQLLITGNDKVVQDLQDCEICFNHIKDAVNLLRESQTM